MDTHFLYLQNSESVGQRQTIMSDQDPRKILQAVLQFATRVDRNYADTCHEFNMFHRNCLALLNQQQLNKLPPVAQEQVNYNLDQLLQYETTMQTYIKWTRQELTFLYSGVPEQMIPVPNKQWLDQIVPRMLTALQNAQTKRSGLAEACK